MLLYEGVEAYKKDGPKFIQRRSRQAEDEDQVEDLRAFLIICEHEKSQKTELLNQEFRPERPFEELYVERPARRKARSNG